MSGIIDFCGMPVDLDTVKDFRIVKTDYIYQPAYREKETREGRSLLKLLANADHSIGFYRMEPYGVVLGRYQNFDLDYYYTPARSVGENIVQKLANRGLAVVDGVGDIVTDLLKLNNVENKPLRIRRHSGMIETQRLRDIPVKIYFSNGQVADEPKNSIHLADIDTPVSSTIVEVPTLLVQAEHPVVLFGNGIDTDDVHAYYNLLLKEKQRRVDELQALKKEKHFIKPNAELKLPKMPKIRLQAPIRIEKNEQPQNELEKLTQDDTQPKL